MENLTEEYNNINCMVEEIGGTHKTRRAYDPCLGSQGMLPGASVV